MPQSPIQSRGANRESIASSKVASTPLCAAVVRAFDRISGGTGQVFTGADVVEGLSPEERSSIGAMTRVPILECVGRELSRARNLRLVASPGMIAKQRYYVSIHVSATAISFVNQPCVARLVRDAIDPWWNREQRPFRASEIRAEVMSRNRLAEISLITVGHSLRTLARLGVVAIVGRVAGGRHGGSRLFVPSRVIPSIAVIPDGYTCARTGDVPPEVMAWALEQMPPSVLPWPERCQRMVCECWQERLEFACRRGCKPTAVPTHVIVERLRAIAADGEPAVTSERVATCLKQAANVKFPCIARIRVPGIHTSFWIGTENPGSRPSTVRHQNDLAKSASRNRVANVRSVTDVERVAALLRAHERQTGRPAATILELRKVIAAMPKNAQRKAQRRSATLQSVGDLKSGRRPRLERLPSAVVASVAARYSGDHEHQTTRPSVRDLGRVGAHAYFATGARDGRAEAYVAWLRVDREWKESDIEDEVRVLRRVFRADCACRAHARPMLSRTGDPFSIECESIPLAIAIGRARRIIALLGSLRSSLAALDVDSALSLAYRDGVQMRLTTISDAVDEYAELLSVAEREARLRGLCLPDGVEMDDVAERLFGSEIYHFIAQFTGPLKGTLKGAREAPSGALQGSDSDARFASSVATKWFDRHANVAAWKPQSKRWRDRARVYYDQFRTYTRAAALYGGPVAAATATLARIAAGPLRDVRFVLLALEDPNPFVRLRAVAALAYLSSGTTATATLDAMSEDSASGVRRLAAWARGFVATAGQRSLARREGRVQGEYAITCNPVMPIWVEATLGASTMAQAATPRGWWAI